MQHYLEIFKYCPACGSRRFVVNDFKSKRCEDCGFVYYYNAAAAVVAIITDENGRFLVARRGEEPAKGTLDLIGGFCDPGESSEEAIVREIEEETGYIVEGIPKILYSVPNTYQYSKLLVNTCDNFYHIRIDSNASLQASDDVAACWWVEPQDIRLEDFGLDSVRNGLERFLRQSDLLKD